MSEKKHVVSLSLGTSKRDKRSEATILGTDFLIERIGTDGDFKKYQELLREYDGKVDAIGVGGADVYVVVDDRQYPWRQIQRVAESVKKTPVVDGSGLKHTLERDTVEILQREGTVDFRNLKVLLVSGVDRFGMAQAMEKAGAKVTYGDLMFGLGLPFPIRSYDQVRKLASILLPILTRLPQTWVYPIGAAQEKRKPQFQSAFADADLIAGDWHLIRKALPDKIEGKTIHPNRPPGRPRNAQGNGSPSRHRHHPHHRRRDLRHQRHGGLPGRPIWPQSHRGAVPRRPLSATMEAWGHRSQS